MDIIWFIIGGAAGYLLGFGTRQNNVPEDLEKCNTERNQQEIDIAYYKKLTKKLVDENAELRKIINSNTKTKKANE